MESDDHGILPETIGEDWCRAAYRDEGNHEDGRLTTDERSRLAKLQRERLRLGGEPDPESGDGVLREDQL